MHLLQKFDFKKETQRLASQRTRILKLLKGDKSVFTQDLQRIAFNYTMRISELRKDGHKILASYIKPGVFKYTYMGHDDDQD